MFSNACSIFFSTYAKRLAIVMEQPYQLRLRTLREALLAAAFLVTLVTVWITQNPSWAGLIWVFLIVFARFNRALGRKWRSTTNRKAAV